MASPTWVEEFIPSAVIAKGKLSTSSDPLLVGDWFCVDPADASGITVTKAVGAALALAGGPLAVCKEPALPGANVSGYTAGYAPNAITGLGPGIVLPVRINTTTARSERVGAISSTDYGVGIADTAGGITLKPNIGAFSSTPGVFLAPARVATTAALPANNRSGNVITASANGALAAQDGVSLSVSDRILVKDEVLAANNGVYTVTSLGSGGTPFVLTRATDADASAEFTSGMGIPVTSGTLNGGKIFQLVVSGTITLNTTALYFSVLLSSMEFGDVRRYGALVANSSAAAGANKVTIQTAVDAVNAAGGGVVYVPPGGAYQINNRIVIKSNVDFQFRGAKLFLANTSNAFLLTIAAGATNVRIIGGELDGNKANNPSGSAGIQNEDATARNVVIERVWVHDCKGDGCRPAGNDVKVLGCTFESNGVAGLAGAEINYFVFANNYARNNVTHGIGLIGTGTYGVIANNTAENNGPTADNFTGYGASNQFITWANNVSRKGGNNGVHVGGAYITFINNTIEDAVAYGLIARNNDSSTMVGFTCVGNLITNSGDIAQSGMWLGFLADFTVTGNTVKGSAAHGILVQESCVDGVISGNAVNDNGALLSADGIRLDGVAGTCSRINVTGNICSNNPSDGIQITDSTEILVQGNDCKDNARPLTVSGSSSGVRVIGNDFLGNVTDAPTITAGTIDYWADSPNGGTLELASAATLTLSAWTDYFKITGTTDLTSITASWAQRRVVLKFDGALTVTDTGNIKIAGSFPTAADSTLTLVCDGTDWWEACRTGPSGQVAVALEDVADTAATANIDVPIAASTSYTHVIQVRAEDASADRCTVRCVVDTIRSGSGAPTTSGASIVFQSGSGLSVSATISGNNLRIATTQTMGASAFLLTRVWEVERDQTVEDS